MPLRLIIWNYVVVRRLWALMVIPYSGKLLREKTFANWWKYDFRGLSAFATPKDTTPQISQRKLSRTATKPQNSRKFSPSKVFRYTVGISIHCSHNTSYMHIPVHQILSPRLPPLKKKGRSWVHAQMHLSLQFMGDFGNLKYLALQTMPALCRMLKVCECIGARKGCMYIAFVV